MKAKFNQTGSVAAAATCIALMGLLLLLPFIVVMPPSKPVIKTPTVHLPDNVTSAEIQTALDTLPSGGGEVVLPPGIFQVRQPIVLRRDGQTLRGSGAATVLRLADNANSPVIILGEPVNNPKRIVKNLCVRELFIDGNRNRQQRELWHEQGEGSEIRNNGITIQGVCDSSIEHVVAARCRSGGVVTTLGCRGLTVRGLEAFDNEFDGLACYLTTDSLFTDLYLHDNPGAGISLDLAFNHNTVSNAILTANDLGIFMRASHENKFYAVSIHGSRSHGVFMANAEDYADGVAHATPLSECARNAFTNLAAADCGGAAVRINNPTCTNNLIIRPQFAGNLRGDLSLAEPGLVTVW